MPPGAGLYPGKKGTQRRRKAGWKRKEREQERGKKRAEKGIRRESVVGSSFRNNKRFTANSTLVRLSAYFQSTSRSRPLGLPAPPFPPEGEPAEGLRKQTQDRSRTHPAYANPDRVSYQ